MLTVWARSLDGGRMATTRVLGLAIAGVVLAFAISQFRYYLATARMPDSQTPGENDRERRFYRRQAWRRLQISALSAIAGGCMLAGMLTPYGDHPRVFMLSWLGVVLFGVWVVALALVDCVSTWMRFSEERQVHEAERLALRYKMDKFHEEALRERQEAEELEEKTRTGPKNEEK